MTLSHHLHRTGRTANAFLHAVVRFGAGLGWRVWFHLAVIAALIVLTQGPQ